MCNQNKLLEQNLGSSQIDLLRNIGVLADSIGMEAYLVGGSVRDIFLNNVPDDLDIIIVGDISKFVSSIVENLGCEIISRSQFQTVKLKVSDIVFDLTLARSEYYLHPGDLPTVALGSIDQDLARRDFTVNSMAISLSVLHWGKLLDPFGGRDDLNNKLLRALHSKSFMDDATRIIRAIRYAGRLGLDFEPKTEQMIERDLNFLSAISGIRIWDELSRLLSEAKPIEAVKLAQNFGVLKAIHPAFKIKSKDLINLTKFDLVCSKGKVLSLFAAILFNLSELAIEGIRERLNFMGRESKLITDIKLIKSIIKDLGSFQTKPSIVYNLLNDLDLSSIEGCALITEDSIIRENLCLHLSKLRHIKTFLGGSDIIGMGVPAGPMVGELLSNLLEARLDGLIYTRDDEQKYAACKIIEKLS